mgnify:CR=1 FL=1
MQWQGQEIWGKLFQKEDIFTVHDGTIMEKPCAQYEYIITDFFYKTIPFPGDQSKIGED